MPTPYKVKTQKQYFKGIIYGERGVGKTLLAGTAQDHPEMSDVLFVNVENGLMTLTDREVDVLAVTIGRDEQTGQPNGKIADDLETVFWDVINKKHPAYADVKTVVIDSVSELQNQDIEDVVNLHIKKKKQDRTTDEIYQEDYGVDTARLRRIFRLFRDAPLHVIYIASVKTVMPKSAASKKNENVEPIEVSPQMTAKLGESLMGFVNFVWLLYQDQGKRFMLTEERGVFKAKTRGPKFARMLGGKVENPTMPALYDLLVKSTDRNTKA